VKEKYIALMERTLSAYSEERINRYFNDVKEKGLREHGFPRLASDIGILIAHGRRLDLKDLFIQMMTFCCENIPQVSAANDFSVREVIACIREVEASDAIDGNIVAEWKRMLSEINPLKCYDVRAVSPSDRVKNWALFSCLSEFFRQKMGLCNSEEFIDTQIASQLRWIDENGMYMDGEGIKHHHMNYDIVPRGLFSLLLSEGYRGKHFEQVDGLLKKSALLTLKMQSPNGEIAFGGRSNQFLFTELWMIVIFEYEAKRYAREGNLALAKKFKAASARALSSTEYWLGLEPIHHIRNRFPLETSHGCEGYAYFDKYMITVASNLHAAYMVCDDNIDGGLDWDTEPSVFATSRHFHKVFAKAGGYGIEFDLDADPHYDASGLGRVHRADAPPAICLSVPCPEHPVYKLTIDKPTALSLCPAININESWTFGTSHDIEYEVLSLTEEETSARVALRCNFSLGLYVDSEYTVSEDGVDITLTGEGKIGFMLPAFYFDGEKYTEITARGNTLTVKYNGWACRYTVSGDICSEMYRHTTAGRVFAKDVIAANRNGYYKCYLASGEDTLKVKIEIIKL